MFIKYSVGMPSHIFVATGLEAYAYGCGHVIPIETYCPRGCFYSNEERPCMCKGCGVKSGWTWVPGYAVLDEQVVVDGVLVQH